MFRYEEIEELAKGPKETGAALDARLTELRSRGARILDCIQYVRRNQGCGLKEATALVVDSPAWIDQRKAFWRHQEEMFLEYVSTARERGETPAFEMTITPDGTTYRFSREAAEEPRSDAVEPSKPTDEQGI